MVRRLGLQKSSLLKMRHLNPPLSPCVTSVVGFASEWCLLAEEGTPWAFLRAAAVLGSCCGRVDRLATDSGPSETAPVRNLW